MLKGFRNFLMRGDVIVVAVGLVVALAFSNLVKAFTDNVINPLVASAQGSVKGAGLGWQLGQRRRRRHISQPRRVHLRNNLLHPL
jgi:large conductance mechanosensitive channel